MDRHIIWKYKNLKLPDEAFSRKEQKIIRQYINENIYFKPDIEKYSESIYRNPVKKIVAYNKERKEPQYVPETEMQKMEKQAKTKFEQQHYTYKIKEKRNLKSLLKPRKEIGNKQKTYIEQIEERRNSVKSQILMHR